MIDRGYVDASDKHPFSGQMPGALVFSKTVREDGLAQVVPFAHIAIPSGTRKRRAELVKREIDFYSQNSAGANDLVGGSSGDAYVQTAYLYLTTSLSMNECKALGEELVSLAGEVVMF